MAEVIKQQQPKDGKPLFVFERIPDNALVQDMIEKARLYSTENVKKAVKTRYSLTKEQFTAINEENRKWYKNRLEDVIPQIRHDSAEEAFQLVVCIPIMVMRDHFGDLMKKEVDQKNREIRFYEYLEESKKYLTPNLIVALDTKRKMMKLSASTEYQ